MAKSIQNTNVEWDRISTTMGKVRDRIHRNLLANAEQVRENGDTSSLAYGFKLLWKTGANRRAILQWIEKHLMLRYDSVTGKFTKRNDKVKLSEIDVEKAAGSPFYEDEDENGQTAKDKKKWNSYGRLKSIITKEKKIAAEYKENPAAFESAPAMLSAQDVKFLEQLLAKHEQEVSLEKPQPKSDKAVFDVNGGHQRRAAA